MGSVVDVPSTSDIIESVEDVSTNNTVTSTLEDNHLIPVILNGDAQKDKYEVGTDFKKILSSFPEQFEQQSQDISVEKENIIPSTNENYSTKKEAKKDYHIINDKKKEVKFQKDIKDKHQNKKMGYIQENIVKLPEAYVTLATNDDYAIGALVLGHSLHSVGTTRKLVIMITEDVSWDVRPMLNNVFDEVIIVNVM